MNRKILLSGIIGAIIVTAAVFGWHQYTQQSAPTEYEDSDQQPSPEPEPEQPQLVYLPKFHVIDPSYTGGFNNLPIGVYFTIQNLGNGTATNITATIKINWMQGEIYPHVPKGNGVSIYSLTYRTRQNISRLESKEVNKFLADELVDHYSSTSMSAECLQYIESYDIRISCAEGVHEELTVSIRD